MGASCVVGLAEKILNPLPASACANARVQKESRILRQIEAETERGFWDCTLRVFMYVCVRVFITVPAIK